MGKTGSKGAYFICSCGPNGAGALLDKRAFAPLFTHFCPLTGPFSRHFGIFCRQKRVTTGSKRAKSNCLSIPNGLRSLLEKPVLAPVLTPFWSHNGPFSGHFGLLHGPKRVISGSKQAKNNCLSIPNDLGSLVEKCIFDTFLTHF